MRPTDDELERPPDSANSEAARVAPAASVERRQGEAKSNAASSDPQAQPTWQFGLPQNLIALVAAWREAVPREPLPAVLQQELAHHWANATGGAAVKTIPGEYIGAAQAGDRIDEVARGLYDALGHDRASRLAAELVAEIEHRGASAQRGRELLDAWLSDAP